MYTYFICTLTSTLSIDTSLNLVWLDKLNLLKDFLILQTDLGFAPASFPPLSCVKKLSQNSILSEVWIVEILGSWPVTEVRQMSPHLIYDIEQITFTESPLQTGFDTFAVWWRCKSRHMKVLTAVPAQQRDAKQTMIRKTKELSLFSTNLLDRSDFHSVRRSSSHPDPIVYQIL